MDAKTKKIIIYSVIAILVVLAIFFFIRYKKLKSETESAQNVPTIPQSAIYGGSGSPSTPAPVTIYHGADFTKWKKGDVLKANGLVNIYSSVLISTTNIVASRNSGETIGVVDSIVGAGIVKIKYLSVNWLAWASANDGYVFANGSNITS